MGLESSGQTGMLSFARTRISLASVIGKIPDIYDVGHMRTRLSTVTNVA